MFADFFFQTPRMLTDRERYIHFGRMQHVALHAIGSAIVFAVVLASPVFILATVVLEAIVHYHIDWAKGRYSWATGFTPKDAAYWRAVGVDQALHQLTYVAMVALWLTCAVA